MRAFQEFEVTNSPYTVSVETSAGIHLAVEQGAIKIVDQDIDTGVYSYTFIPDAGSLTLSLTPHTNKSFDAKWVQLEPLAFNTSHMTGTRSNSVLTIPVEFKSQIESGGAIFFWFNPQSSITTDERVLIEIGDVRIEYDNLLVTAYSGESSGYVTVNPEVGVWYAVLLSWTDGVAKLQVGNAYQYIPNFQFSSGIEHVSVGFSETFTDKHRADALIDDLYILDQYNNKIDEFKESTIKTPFLYVSFDGNVSKFDNSLIELPIKNIHRAPLIVQKSNGTELRRMTFMDPDTGEYVPYAIQRVKCVGSKVFEVPFDNIDTETKKPVAYTVDGDFIEILAVDKNKLTLDIDPQRYFGQTLTIIYQPRDSYTVDYGDNDLVKIMLGRHDGQTLDITYENNEDSPYKLLTNVDLNAMNNPNHDGFIYVTDQIFPVENINYTVSPKEIRANGITKSIIIVDARDRYGNIVSDIDIRLEAEYGTILTPPQGYVMEVGIQQQAGRYIFHYQSPMIDASFDGYVYDGITIKAYKGNELQTSVKTSVKLLSV